MILSNVSDSDGETARSTRGFTLIELLTVIAIIAVLMGLLFSAMSGVVKSRQKVQAKNDIMNIVNAIKAFHTEYGKYPDPGTNDKIIAASGDISPVIKALTAKDDILNPRKIVFMEPPMVKDPGHPRSGVYSDKFYDPWGVTYGIALDMDYDNQVNPGYGVIQTGAAVMSNGADRTKAATLVGSDDVVSWQ